MKPIYNWDIIRQWNYKFKITQYFWYIKWCPIEEYLKEEVAEECKSCYGKKSFSKYTVHWIENITCNRCNWTWKEPYRENPDFVEDRLEKLKEIQSEPKKIGLLAWDNQQRWGHEDFMIFLNKLNEIILHLNKDNEEPRASR